ncbi:MAG TPA: PAS domain S-box protein, partial [Phycisphaerae bacterium]|nr:PAS domain S-box protein [Phycisphaerae bacterium]
SADAIISKDLNGQITSWNAAAERIFGYTAAEVIGKSIMLLIPREKEREEEEILHRLRSGEPIKHFHSMRMAKDGRAVPVSLTISPIRDDRGHIVGASSVARDITDQVRIENELRDNEQRYRQLVNALPAAVYTCDASGKILLYNDAAVELWGRRPEAGELWCGSMKIFTPAGEPVELDTCPMAVALTEGRTVKDEEIVVERPDGTRRNVLPHPRPFFDPSGKVVGAVNMLLDITELKAAERELAAARDALIDANERLEARVRARTDELVQVGESLRRSNAKFKAIWDQGVFAGLIGLDGSLLDVNRTFLEQCGYARQELIGRHFWDTPWWNRSPAAMEWVRSGIGQAVGGRPFHGESVYFLADGSERIVDFALMPIKDENGQVEFIVSTGIDITDRRRAEEERQAAEVLRESEERFRQMADHAPVLIWLNGPDGCEFVNREYLRFVGRTQEHVRGSNWQKFVHPDDLGEYLRIYQEASQSGLPFSALARFLREDGQYRWLNSAGTPRFATDGSVVGYVGCSVDITEIKRSEEMLTAARDAAEAASQSKDRFLAILSHELRTPLTPVLMTAAAMKNDPSLAPQTREDLTMIHRNVELETMLIDDLLDLSRITTGKLRLQSRPISLNDAVRSVCQICAPQVAEKSIQQHVDLDPRAGTVLADPARLQQVLWNVLKNAVKFTPEGGEISVTTSAGEDGYYRVIVKDNGVGIAPENQKRIFQAFDQGDSRIAHQFGGLGLGLAISKALIELLNGSIRAESRGLGTGATFIVELPALVASAEVREPKKPAHEAAASIPLRILVVEDHADTARILSRMLRNMGYVVTTAHRASKALELIGSEPFDVLVSDVGLPDATGYELMGKINELHPMKGIAMSGYGMDDDIRRSRDAGFSDHLVKPVDIVQLDQSIRRVAGLSN